MFLYCWLESCQSLKRKERNGIHTAQNRTQNHQHRFPSRPCSCPFALVPRRQQLQLLPSFSQAPCFQMTLPSTHQSFPRWTLSVPGSRHHPGPPVRAPSSEKLSRGAACSHHEEQEQPAANHLLCSRRCTGTFWICLLGPRAAPGSF